jgi:hypothetical protein
MARAVSIEAVAGIVQQLESGKAVVGCMHHDVDAASADRDWFATLVGHKEHTGEAVQH